MLTQLSVRNFVLIESLDLELGEGLNVLSGGSGEGKTLLLNALRFVLGEGSNGKTAAARWVRAGSPQAKVRVVFECPEGKEVLERTLSAAGRGRCLLNDTVLPLPAYRARAGRLGEFFGQGQAQRLTEPEAQRELLDAVAGTRDLVQRFSSERDELLTRARTHDRLAREEDSLRQDWGEQQAQREALGALAPEPGEFEELIARVDQLEAQADQASALAALSRDLEGEDQEGYGGRGEDEGLADALAAASATLASLRTAWPDLDSAHETLAQAAELLQEASRSVASVRTNAGFDPQELDALRRRESEFRSLARRLGLRSEGLAARWLRLRTLDPEAIAAERAALAIRVRRGRKRLASLSKELHVARTAAAQSLSRSVLARLPELGLGEARFEVRVSPSGAGLSGAGQAPNPLSIVPSPESGASASSADPPARGSLLQAAPSLSAAYLATASLSPGRGAPGEGGTEGRESHKDMQRPASREGVALEPELLADHPAPHGGDRVELAFSANPALAIGTLDQASGGELGRVFLALGLEAPANAALLVFDEVDQNVGARLGTAVGGCLERMSHSRQVLAITHLAPVAARARLHHRITKRSGVTRVETLEGEDRIDELALMIRGEPLTEASRAQARELLAEALASVALNAESRGGKIKATRKKSASAKPKPSGPKTKSEAKAKPSRAEATKTASKAKGKGGRSLRKTSRQRSRTGAA